jgi:hypothetical protein
VTYAALSLAEQLGAGEIELYGADYSFPQGVTYAKGAYVYSLFNKRQNRLSPLEACASSFLYRTDLEKETCLKEGNTAQWYYRTKILNFYREKLREKAGSMGANLIQVKGLGAPLNIKNGKKAEFAKSQNSFSYGKARTSNREFLTSYKKRISGFEKLENNAALFLSSLEEEDRRVFTTILPLAAALKHRNSYCGYSELIEGVKAHCIKEIDAVLSIL